jgi:hypothetical protein
MRRSRAVSWVGLLGACLLLATAAGCYDTPRPNCAFLCGSGGACPDGYQCGSDDRCHLVLENNQLAMCEDTLPTADASNDAPVADAGPDAAIPDAGPDAALPDAAPDAAVTDHVGTISLQDLSIQGHPELGHGLSITIDLTPLDPIQPVVDTNPGSLFGCKAWVYDLTMGQAPPVTDANHGDISVMAPSTTIPTCTFIPGQGYRCIAGGGAGGAGDLIQDDAAGPGTAALVDMAPAAYTFSAADVGRYVVISGATPASNNGAFPIVGVNPASNAVIYGNPAAASGAFGGTFTVIAGLGPVPPVMGLPDPIQDADTLDVAIQPASGEFAFPAQSVAAGDAFVLDMASQLQMNTIPMDGSAVTLSCDATSCGAGSALGSLITITTTDGLLPPGAPDYYFPAPVQKTVVVRCAQLAPSITIPSSVMQVIADSGATRVRTLFIRPGLAATGNADSTNPVNIVVGHALAGFTTTAECVTAAECGASTDCATYTCTNNTCGVTFAPMGMPTATGQTAGDCKELQCDGNGGTTQVTNDADVPNDGLQCTTDACAMGTPMTTNVPGGTPCNEGGGTMCDGNGACVP